MEAKVDYLEFASDIQNRGIRYLVHFTRFENITAIVGAGKILPRERLHNIEYQWRHLIPVNSEYRRDNPNYLNTSVMHPNIYLFRIFSARVPNSKFCVIGIKPSYIYERDTNFAITNATYGSAINFGINDNIKTFREIFAESILSGPNRRQYYSTRSPNLSAYLPTDQEAEVLIKAEIPYEDILFIAFRNQVEYDFLASIFDTIGLPEEKFRVEPTLFEPR